MTDASTRHRWDPVVKLTHWAIALSVLANAVIMEEGSAGHAWVGYALAAILALRLLWGMIAPAEARFSAFSPRFHRAIAHLRDIAAKRSTAHRSHNPLGALIVYAIWGMLLPGSERLDRHAAVSAPPMAAEAEEEERRGIEAGERGRAEGGEGEENPLGEVHEAAVNLLYGLILLHIGGVVFESRRQRRNLALAMLPGGA